MAIIKCLECGKDISNKALSCPNCGVPLNENISDDIISSKNETNNIEKPKNQATIKKEENTMSSFFVGITIVVIMFILFKSCSGNDNKSKSSSVEEGASSVTEITEVQKEAAKQVIQMNGNTCDSIISMRKFITSEGYYVYCNDYRYSYEIENKGGNWTVTIK